MGEITISDLKGIYVSTLAHPHEDKIFSPHLYFQSDDNSWLAIKMLNLTRDEFQYHIVPFHKCAVKRKD